jgi:hypothetical protein
MQVNIFQSKIYCLTCEPEYGRKRQHIREQLQDISFEFIEPIIGIAKHKSGASGFMRMIEAGLIAQDPKKPFRPFLMLEDDVAFDDNQKKYYTDNPIVIPEDADILYVGLSNCSMNSYAFHYANYYKSVESHEHIVRIQHMLSTHGILVCSALGAAAIQRTMMEVWFSERPWDVPLAFIQPYYRVYALRRPLVYQDSQYGGDEGCTHITLDNSENAFPAEWKTRDLVTIHAVNKKNVK